MGRGMEKRGAGWVWDGSRDPILQSGGRHYGPTGRLRTTYYKECTGIRLSALEIVQGCRLCDLYFMKGPGPAKQKRLPSHEQAQQRGAKGG